MAEHCSEACKERNDLAEGVVREITQNNVCDREIQCVMYMDVSDAHVCVVELLNSHSKKIRGLLWKTPMALDMYSAASFPCLDVLLPC